MTTMKRTLLALTLIAAAGTAHAQRGHIGDGGRMPETMFPGAQPVPSMPEPMRSAPLERYPNTESLSRDRIESQGYSVNDMTQQNDGSWLAGAHCICQGLQTPATAGRPYPASSTASACSSVSGVP